MNNTWLCLASKKIDDLELRAKLWNISIEMIERRMGPFPALAAKPNLKEGTKQKVAGNQSDDSENDEFELVNDGSEQ